MKGMIEEEEHHSIEAEEMKEILRKSSFSIERDGKLIKRLIHSIFNSYEEEGFGIVKYVECGNIEFDIEFESEQDMKGKETLNDILKELSEIPIVRETYRYLKKKKEKMNEKGQAISLLIGRNSSEKKRRRRKQLQVRENTRKKKKSKRCSRYSTREIRRRRRRY